MTRPQAQRRWPRRSQLVRQQEPCQQEQLLQLWKLEREPADELLDLRELTLRRFPNLD